MGFDDAIKTEVSAGFILPQARSIESIDIKSSSASVCGCRVLLVCTKVKVDTTFGPASVGRTAAFTDPFAQSDTKSIQPLRYRIRFSPSLVLCTDAAAGGMTADDLPTQLPLSTPFETGSSHDTFDTSAPFLDGFARELLNESSLASGLDGDLFKGLPQPAFPASPGGYGFPQVRTTAQEFAATTTAAEGTAHAPAVKFGQHFMSFTVFVHGRADACSRRITRRGGTGVADACLPTNSRYSERRRCRSTAGCRLWTATSTGPGNAAAAAAQQRQLRQLGGCDAGGRARSEHPSQWRRRRPLPTSEQPQSADQLG